MPIYDVENRFSYYKSYSDNILVGPTRPTMGSYDWQRSVSGSVVSGSEEWKGATLLSDYTYKKANPFFRSGEVRYLRLNSASQTIKDTITPDILSIYLTGTYGTGSVDYQYFSMYFSTDGFSITSSYPGMGETEIGQRINNVEWIFSYPYERKYKKVALEKINRPTDETAGFKNVSSLISPGDTGEAVAFWNIENIIPYFPPDIYSILNICLTTSGSILNSESLVFQRYYEYNGVYNGSSFLFNTLLPQGTLINSNLSAKLVFGIKPKPLATNYEPGTILPSNRKLLVQNATGSIIEGWKYGLYNGIPTNFSAVFRQNHYGQFRDILEQRIYTKTYNNPLIGGPMDNNGGINFISGSALLGENNDYITASIYASDNVTEAYRVNPYGSGIFDKEYRASQPWYDNDPRVGT